MATSRVKRSKQKRKFMQKKIGQLVREGKPLKQAVAISLSMIRSDRRKKRRGKR